MNVVHGAHTSAAFAEPPFRVLSSPAFLPRRSKRQCPRRGGAKQGAAAAEGAVFPLCMTDPPPWACPNKIKDEIRTHIREKAGMGAFFFVVGVL